MELFLGNTAPVEVLAKDEAKKRGHKLGDLARHDDERVRVPHDLGDAEETVTHVTFPPAVSIGEAFTNVTHPQGLWGSHSDEPPSWVASDSDGLASIVAEHFTTGEYDGHTCEVISVSDVIRPPSADGRDDDAAGGKG